MKKQIGTGLAILALLSVGLLGGCGGGDDAGGGNIGRQVGGGPNPNAGGPTPGGGTVAPGGTPNAGGTGTGQPVAGNAQPNQGFVAQADAGISIPPPPDDPTFKKVIEATESKNFVVRNDSFALSSKEKAFEKDQQTARIMGTMGGFTTYFELPEEKIEETTIKKEAPPLWRISGIILGDAVMALLVKSEGSAAEVLRPGSTISGTNWVVASIDVDKVVLKRGGDTLPKTVTVYLQERMPTDTGSGGGGGNSGGPGGGGPGGGGPGGGSGGSLGVPGKGGR